MTSALPRLFQPLTLRSVTLRNRIVISPMWQYRGQDGFPTDWHLIHLARFADGGAGLVMQEATSVERRGAGTPGDLGIWSDEHGRQLSRLARAIKEHGAVPGIQLGHAGRKARTTTPAQGRTPLTVDEVGDAAAFEAWHPVGPSEVAMRDGVIPKELSEGEIQNLRQAFVDGARRSLEAGYEVLEIHSGHGYLLHQFLSPVTNIRTDGYGGDRAGRSRLLLEVVEDVRGVWPEELPLFVRLSIADGAGWSVQDSIEVSRQLKERGVDVIDCSSGGISGSPMTEGTSLDYGYQVPYAEAVRKGADIPTMAVGLIVDAAHAEDILASGQADLIAIGREALFNPNWGVDAARKLGHSSPYFSLTPDNAYYMTGRDSAVPELRPSTYRHPGEAR